MLLVITNLCLGALRTAVAGPQIAHNSDKKLVTMADAENRLVLRLNYDGRCMLDRVVVRGEEVVPSAMGVCSSIRLGTAEHTTRSGLTSPKVAVAENTVTVSEIRFGGSGVDVEETWSFTVRADRIVWRITRKYLTGGTLDDTGFPGWDFTSPSTWTGALLGTGGVAWFRLFDTPTATYGVHTGPVTFWNRDNGVCLRIVPAVPEGRHAAVRFSRQPRGALSFNYCVTDQELATRHGHNRFLRDKQDVWAPFKVVPGETTVEYTLSGLDYAKAYDRGVFKGIDGAAVREICNTIARLGAVDAKIHGSNGWYSGFAVLHEHWIAQLGLAIDDPHYFRSYAETLDYQRDHAVGPDGRVKPRWWARGPGDAVPGTYDSRGFYECQWGWLMDSQPSFVINVAEQFDFTGDLEWVRGHKSSCERVLEYMLRRDSNGNGLVEMMTDNHQDRKASDWIDKVWASFENGLVNAEMYYALGLWADIEELLGDQARATKYRRCAAKLKASFNRSTADGGLWDPVRKCYAYWRDKDGSIHGTNLVTPVNFMAVAYGICDDPARRAAILDQIEDQMRKEKLFIWPLNMFSYTQEEGGGWPFPDYENGDIFLGWAEVGIRAYARHNPAVAVRCVKNVLDKYAEDGLAFQRYLRRSQTGLGGDILSNMSSPVVGLYRNIYGVQPKWNRLYLEPHLTPELNGTRLKYWLRGQWYAIDLGMRRCRITVNDFSVSAAGPLAVNAKGDTLEYFRGNRKTFSMAVSRSVPAPLELRIDAWPSAVAGLRKWTETAAQDGMTVRHVVSDLVPGAEYTLFRNGAQVTTVRSDAAGNIAFEVAISDSQQQTYELKR